MHFLVFPVTGDFFNDKIMYENVTVRNGFKCVIYS